MLTVVTRSDKLGRAAKYCGAIPRCIKACFDIVYQLIFFSTLGHALCRCFMYAWLDQVKLQPLSALMLHVRSKNYRKQHSFFDRLTSSWLPYHLHVF